jgi:hypothetical protein
MSFVRNVAWAGGVAGLLSALAAAACSRVENRRAAPAINAVSHIAWGGAPPFHEGPAGRNFVTGAALHAGASLFWASIFEALFGRAARGSGKVAVVAGAATAAAACVTDYCIVSRRFRPGFEAFLSRPSLLGVYTALAAGFALGARLSARNRNGRHQRSNAHMQAPRSGRMDTVAASGASEPASFTRLNMP